MDTAGTAWVDDTDDFLFATSSAHEARTSSAKKARRCQASG